MKRILRAMIPIIVLGNIAFAQSKVEGLIQDNRNEPIAGATIVIKGTNTHTVTDISGKFSIPAPKQLPFTLRISSVGFKTQEVQIYELLDEPLDIALTDDNLLNEVVVTSRRRQETVQEVPIPISVVGGDLIDDAGAFNVNRVKELVPTVQLYSSNPRNTTLNIRGLGSTFGLTNDGLDPGVGFYIDGVYFARPAVTTLDFIDIEQIEVLRGPQGTLFGKNTTAGAFNITTRKPSFTPGASFETSFGNYGFLQAKASVTGTLIKNKLAARLSFSGTQRDGILYNVATQKPVNDINNLGFRGQLLFTPTDKVSIILIGDQSRQRPDGFAQVFAGVVKTQRADYRQFDQIIAELNYELPSRNPFDRVIDHDTPWRSGNDLGGFSLNADIELGSGKLTSTTAWRYWNWDPSNDRDYTGLQGLALSQAPSKHQNWSQEVRYAGEFSKKLSGVVGVFAIGQVLKSNPYHSEEAGRDQWRFQQNTPNTELWQTPGLFEGHGSRIISRLESFGAAAFANIDWAITNRLHVLPGIRYNYDTKTVDFNRQAYGLYETEDPALIAIRTIYNNQAFDFTANESNVTGQLTVTYKPVNSINAFATYSTSYKPVGVNLGGLPNVAGQPDLSLAQIKPEYTTHFEIGIKTSPTKRSTLNLVAHYTGVKDYQTLVQDPDPALVRGYLANAGKIRVTGVELDANVRPTTNFSLFGALAYTDGKYIDFKNAPLALENVGAPVADLPFEDVSGERLPGISKWAGNIGGEITSNQLKILGTDSKLFFAADAFYRSEFSSSATPSQFLNIDGYAIVNARLGFRSAEGLSITVWARNLLDQDYFEQLLIGGGNAGHYAGVLGDPRTYGVTLRQSF